MKKKTEEGNIYDNALREWAAAHPKEYKNSGYPEWYVICDWARKKKLTGFGPEAKYPNPLPRLNVAEGKGVHKEDKPSVYIELTPEQAAMLRGGKKE